MSVARLVTDAAARGWARAVLVNPYFQTCTAMDVRVTLSPRGAADLQRTPEVLKALGADELGRMVGADGVVLGKVRVWSERVGGLCVSTMVLTCCTAHAEAPRDIPAQPGALVHGVVFLGRVLVFRAVTSEPLLATAVWAVVDADVDAVRASVTFCGADAVAARTPTRPLTCLACGAAAPVRCSACRFARYCSPGCQAADWPRHAAMCVSRRQALFFPV